jgi:hypothetical protein
MNNEKFVIICALIGGILILFTYSWHIIECLKLRKEKDKQNIDDLLNSLKNPKKVRDSIWENVRESIRSNLGSNVHENMKSNFRDDIEW